MIYRWFAEPERRGLHPTEDHELRARGHVASLRADSEEFAAPWDRHEVGRRTTLEKRFLHPLVGEARLRMPAAAPVA